MSIFWPALPEDCTVAGPGGGPHPRRGELIGRGPEMGQLMLALAAARSGRGTALFVTGEPGVGKTRLATEALAMAAETNMVTVRGRASAVGSPVPYRPLVEALLLLSRAGLLPDPEELGRYGPVMSRLLTGARDTGADAAPHLVVAETMLRLLTVVGERKGCLLVLDDLHDADAGTLEVVEYLLDNIGHQPAVLLLVTGCAPGAAAELATRARQRGAAAVLDLAPLSRPDVHLLIAAELRVPPAEVCPDLVHRAVDGSAGIPFVVKELVHDLAGRPDHPDRPDRRTPSVPATVADNVRRQAGRLGPLGAELLGMAALFGRRFALPVLERAIGRDHAELSAVLRAAVASYLITPDGPGAQWYTFRYPLAAEALLDDLGPGERTRYVRRAARALTELHPGLPGTWCEHAAQLHEHAGDTPEAIRLYAEAAGRATGEGAVDRAVELLTRAHRLVEPDTAPELHATVLERLLDAVARSARFDRLPAPAAVLDTLGGDGGEHGIPAQRRAGLHARLSDIATLTGRPAEALWHLDIARALLGSHPADQYTALVDLSAVHVELSRLAPDRLRTATRYALRALHAAQRVDLPDVTCRALLLLGQLAREQDEPTAMAHFRRARAIALARRLPVPRTAADVHLAIVAASHDGRPDRIEQARREALGMGLLPLVHETGFVLALDRIQHGRFDEARDRIREAAADASRLGLGRPLAMLRLAEAVRYAHQGRRAEMRGALERLAPLLDAAPGVRAMSYGLARAFCSLLEERHEAAGQEFAQALAYDAENPAMGEFGKHGIILLLGVLDGRMGRRHHAEVTLASAGATRWNHQFTGLAHAVLLGREGRPDEATAAAGKALEAAEPFPVARRLCLRLVAQSAYDDGWGAPVEWLREAEEYFHGAGLQAVAGASRALLRGMGAPVRQRRTGTERVPADLRRCGITVREYEVARLVAERISNKDIAGRLHISLRTVEKHVASLLQKTGHPNRTAFATATRDLVA
ncbi:helix-turn-helix transcriptional regulator [Streptomyces nojiriensis]|uniref:LuxR family transcriptional regulator n=1 Tax=Streptomyces nojiriensis TaxID=66374 RepID=A0ABQ3SRP4_9ACTN|nr:LuxR family transcriptional regulator [Streptomyces nojiriensis]QTI43988.1 Putative HTH-type transcriptional regulator [Streptomyces nojiriensis]GGR85403.1 LuxR family transcriptional regulator [Streptomyces nojiriensis]GHI70455.1 LuxR family transcriptional regulator [Streptomyces nojiriensis]